MTRILLAAILALCMQPALASKCQRALAEVDKGLANPGKVAAAKVAEARKLRTDGAAQCTAGKQEEAQSLLQRALQLLDRG